jgi:hypothetical protein
MSNQPPELNFLSSKQIAQLLSAVPEERLLLLTKTIDQLHCWLMHRFTYTAVAAAWITDREGQDDPIESLLKSGELCQNDYNRIWRLVDYYQRLWTLVCRVEPFIRKELTEKLTKAKLQYPFQDRYELFVYIVREQTHGEFSLCLETYREVSAGKNEKQFRQLASFLDGKPLTKQQERNLLEPITEAKVKKHAWSLLLLGVAQKNATQRRTKIKDALTDFYAALARLFEDEATHFRIQGSYRWNQGIRQKGTRYGGGYESKS